MEPGHGLKGKKEWILDDDDMNELSKQKEERINPLVLQSR